MDNFLSKFKSITNVFLPDDKVPDNTSNKRSMTRQGLLNQISEHFKSRFEEVTTDESMLFPTSFCIYLHPEDYNRQEQTFAQTAKDMANKFNRLIQEKRKIYPEYTPHATYWLFQFSKFNENDIVDSPDGEITTVIPGEPITVSSIYAVDFSKGNLQTESNIRATRHNKDSNTMEMLNINRDAFLGMDMQTKDRFRIDFNSFGKITDMPLSFDKNHNPEQTALAILKCDENFIGDDGKKGNVYYMTDELIHISGKNDTRRMTSILKLNHDHIKDSHVQIKYFPKERKFRLAAFGRVKLNERIIEEQSSGGNINWVDLSNHSNIFICDEININFKINK